MESLPARGCLGGCSFVSIESALADDPDIPFHAKLCLTPRCASPSRLTLNSLVAPEPFEWPAANAPWSDIMSSVQSLLVTGTSRVGVGFFLKAFMKGIRGPPEGSLRALNVLRDPTLSVVVAEEDLPPEMTNAVDQPVTVLRLVVRNLSFLFDLIDYKLNDFVLSQSAPLEVRGSPGVRLRVFDAVSAFLRSCGLSSVFSDTAVRSSTDLLFASLGHQIAFEEGTESRRRDVLWSALRSRYITPPRPSPPREPVVPGLRPSPSPGLIESVEDILRRLLRVLQSDPLDPEIGDDEGRGSGARTVFNSFRPFFYLESFRAMIHRISSSDGTGPASSPSRLRRIIYLMDRALMVTSSLMEEPSVDPARGIHYTLIEDAWFLSSSLGLTSVEECISHPESLAGLSTSVQVALEVSAQMAPISSLARGSAFYMFPDGAVGLKDCLTRPIFDPKHDLEGSIRQRSFNTVDLVSYCLQRVSRRNLPASPSYRSLMRKTIMSGYRRLQGILDSTSTDGPMELCRGSDVDSDFKAHDPEAIKRHREIALRGLKLVLGDK